MDVHYYLSLTTRRMPFVLAFLKRSWTLSMENPATVISLTWRIWSPKRKPPRAAGDPDSTRLTKIPFEMAFNIPYITQLSIIQSKCQSMISTWHRRPTLPLDPLHRTISLIPWVTMPRCNPKDCPDKGATIPCEAVDTEVDDIATAPYADNNTFG